MTNQSDLERAYYVKRKKYEDEEADLLRQRNQKIAIIEEVQERSHFYLKGYVPDQTFLINSSIRLEHEKENVIETAKVNQRNLIEKVEALDKTYSNQLRQLNE